MEKGMRRCGKCHMPYLYPMEGGTKYHHDCAREVKREQDRLSYRLKTGDRVQTRHHEYFWAWACPTCGSKARTKTEAVRCCEGDWCGYHPEPFYNNGGGLWVWEGKIRKDLDLERAITKEPRTVSRSQSTL